MKDRRKANLGQSLEDLIEHQNELYKRDHVASIQKIPTSWVVRRGYDPRKRKNIIFSAFPKKKSTVDFIGTYQSQAVAFEAKSTTNKTRFPLDNIKKHQRQFLKHWSGLGALAFYLIEFSKYREIYIMQESELAEFVRKNKRKSIPYSYFKKNCRKCRSDGVYVLHYLKELKNFR